MRAIVALAVLVVLLSGCIVVQADPTPAATPAPSSRYSGEAIIQRASRHYLRHAYTTEQAQAVWKLFSALDCKLERDGVWSLATGEGRFRTVQYEYYEDTDELVPISDTAAELDAIVQAAEARRRE